MGNVLHSMLHLIHSTIQVQTYENVGKKTTQRIKTPRAEK